jgi:Na+/proline symporter
MEENRAPFFIAFGFYICWMLALAALSWQKNQTKNIGTDQEFRWHFLGNKGYGSVIVFLTLFSTIYSGYTIVGVPNEASALGYFATRWLSSAPMVGVASLIFAPRARRLSVVRNYDSPNDFVTDRFNNRFLTVMSSLLLTIPQVLYIVAQMYTLKRFIPILSNGMIDGETVAWFMAAVIYVCEAAGGYNAITLTDAVQSVLMVVALIMVPCTAVYWYGGMGKSTMPGCENFEIINCTLPKYAGAACSVAAPLAPGVGNSAEAFANGCLGSLNGGLSGYLTLHPATGWSGYFGDSAATPLAAGGGFYAQTNGFPYLPTATGSAAARGADGSEYFSWTGIQMLDFNLLFMAFVLNPHWIQRSFAAKTDDAVKKANIFLNFAGVVATLSGVAVGIMVAANLAQTIAPTPGQPGRPEAFGLLLSDFINKKGFSAFVGTIAAVAAIAGIMSTTDSALHGISNTWSQDFLENWLYVKKPHLKTQKNSMIASRVFSFVVMLVATCIALYEPQLQDPTSGLYGRLISWQNMILWQAVPTTVLGLYWKRAQAIPLLIGMACGLAAILAMYINKENTAFWGTKFAVKEEDAPLMVLGPAGYVQAMGDGSLANLKPAVGTYYLGTWVWSGFINLFVSWCLCWIEWPKMDFFNINTNRYAKDEVLTHDKIVETMKGTQEPIFNILGASCTIMTVLLCCLSLPYYGESYNGCRLASYLRYLATNVEFDGCAGGNFTGNGIPTWAAAVIGCYICALFTNATAWWTWKTVDKEKNMFAVGTSTAAKIAGTDAAAPAASDVEVEMAKVVEA